MKRPVILSIILVLILLMVSLCGCFENDSDKKNDKKENGKIENIKPIAKIGKMQESSIIEVPIEFIGIGYDPDGKIVLYEWDFDGDGFFDWKSNKTGNTTYEYENVGNYYVKFKVTDDEGAYDINETVIDIGKGLPPLHEAWFSNLEDGYIINSTFNITGGARKSYSGDVILSIQISINNSNWINVTFWEWEISDMYYYWYYVFDTTFFKNGYYSISLRAMATTYGEIEISITIGINNINSTSKEINDKYVKSLTNIIINLTTGKYVNYVKFQEIFNVSFENISKWFSDAFNLTIANNYTRFFNEYVRYYYNCSNNWHYEIGYFKDKTFHKIDFYEYISTRECLQYSYPEEKIINYTLKMIQNLSLNITEYSIRLEKETIGNWDEYCYRVYLYPRFYLNNYQYTEILEYGMELIFYSDNGHFCCVTINRLIENFTHIRPYISQDIANRNAKKYTNLTTNFTLKNIAIRNSHICYLMFQAVGDKYDGVYHYVYVDIQNGNVESWETQTYAWG